MKGEGNQQDYGMRVYDPRVAKFLSIDPLTQSYPELTPYQFASNTPIQATDLDGAETDYRQVTHMLLQHAQIKMTNAEKLYWQKIGTVTATKPNWAEKWKAWNDSKSPTHTWAILSRLVYTTANDAKITATTVTEGKSAARGLDNAGVTDYKERVGAGLFTLSSVVLPVVDKEALTAAKKGAEGLAGGSRDINYLRGKNNCAGCTIAGDASLKGYPASALNHGTTSLNKFMKWFGAERMEIYSSTKSIERVMTNLGDGATGVIFGKRPGDEVGHYFNVVNRGGTIQFLDFQKDVGTRILNPKTLMKEERFESLYFLNTTIKR